MIRSLTRGGGVDFFVDTTGVVFKYLFGGLREREGVNKFILKFSGFPVVNVYFF